MLAQAGRGFLMGAADIVPGVSGGTVALVLGIYPRLVATIHTGAQALGNLARGRPRRAWQRLGEISWPWLLGLLAGIAVAIVTMASLLERLLVSHPQTLAGLFLGLVAGSVVIAWRLVGRTDARTLGAAALLAVLTFVVLGLHTSTAAAATGAAAPPALWAFFLAGALAICAMILPGISGAFILVMLGMYAHVLGAVNDRDLVVLGVFVLGCVVGLAGFSTLLSRLLAQHHDVVLAALVGLMLGSLRVLWPWPDGLESTVLAPPGEPLVAPVALAAVGVVTVIGADLLTRRFAPREPAGVA